MSRLIATAAIFLLPSIAAAQSPLEFFLQQQPPVTQQAVQRARGAAHAPFVGADHSMVASWYGGGERLARKSADGKVFRPGGRTVAHRHWTFGTRLLISYRGRQTVCTVTDRGPALRTGRSIDLSRGCASDIGMLGAGVARVSVSRI